MLLCGKIHFVYKAPATIGEYHLFVISTFFLYILEYLANASSAFLMLKNHILANIHLKPLKINFLMKRLLFYITFLLLAQPLFATSIVVLITPHYIVLGADSRRMILDSNSRVAIQKSVCKIHRTGNYCYALAGMVASGKSFSAEAIVEKSLKKAASYEKAIARIKKEIEASLQKEIDFQRRFQPALFERTMASKDHLLEIVILSVKNKAPYVQIIGFELAGGDDIQVKEYTETCPGDCPEQQAQFYFLGDYSGMEKYLDTRPSFSDPFSLVEKLITVQSQATPTSVAAPVNIVKFTSGGVEWVK